MLVAVRNPLVVIQRNPLSGSGRGRRELLQLIRTLRKHGFQVRMFANRSLLDRYVQQPETAARLHCLVAAGGDGTLVSVADRHPTATLALLPLGTENLVARYLSIPCCGRTVGRIIATGFVRIFDSGIVQQQRFLLMISCGPDARVIQLVNQNRTRNISRIDYLVPVFRTLLLEPLHRYQVRTDEHGKVLEGCHVLVTNIPRYGFDLRFSPEASPDDGTLHVRIVHCTSRLQMLRHAFRVLFRLRPRASEVTVLHAQRVTITLKNEVTGAPLSQFDGEPGPSPPLNIRVAPASVRLLCRPLNDSNGAN